MLPPEAVWGYEKVTATYNEKPSESWQKIIDRVKELYPDADEDDIIRLIEKRAGFKKHLPQGVHLALWGILVDIPLWDYVYGI